MSVPLPSVASVISATEKVKIPAGDCPFETVDDSLYPQVAQLLLDVGWCVRYVDVSQVVDRSDFFRRLQVAFRLPDSVTNFDALHDMLRDVPDFFACQHFVAVVRSANDLAQRHPVLLHQLFHCLTQTVSWAQNLSPSEAEENVGVTFDALVTVTIFDRSV